MPVIDRIAAFADDLTAWRHDFHAHPELGFEEVRTAGIVADKLKSWGVEVHTGIGKTGVVGLLTGKRAGNRRVGLRADMDALPMQEASGRPEASTVPGRFHGCGHDGHTTMLLGAARYLAETRDFAGTAVFIFQPAEEGLGGARAMLADGLFDRFPCDEIYGMHNWPVQTAGTVQVKPGTAMAGSDFFDIRIKGRGSHGAQPHLSHDPLVAAAALVQALQTIVSRNLDPASDGAVVSVTQIHSGSAYNVVPAEATLAGTMRFFDTAVAEMIRTRMKELAAGIGAAFNVEVEVELRPVFDVMVNDVDLSAELVAAAADVVGPLAGEKTSRELGSEDFADMLRVVPGAYCTIAHSTPPAVNTPVHNPRFGFDDAILPVGASVLARVVERRLAP